MKDKYNVDYALSEIIKIKNIIYSRIKGAWNIQIYLETFIK